MIPYGRQSINKADVRVVTRVLESPWLTQGPNVAAFEEAVAAYCKVPYAVAVSNGTAGLHLAYIAADLKTGDEVITTPNTFVATTNMLLALGVRPVFCDIRLDTYNVDESKIESLITAKTKAIVPVHFGAHPVAMEAILRIAKRHKLLVIEDGCHALGAKYHDRPIGSLGDMTIFSFHPVKPITTGEGGMVLTQNKEFYHRLIAARSHGVTKDANGFNVMTTFGYNYRMTDMQAALGSSQLKRLDKFLKKRHEVVRWYTQEFDAQLPIILPTELRDVYSGWHLYVIRVKNSEDRLPLYQYLKHAGIGVNLHYPAVYSHPYYREHGFAKTVCPHADLYGATALTLPLHTLLTRADVRFVCRTIKSFYDRNH